jgi:hemoglobin-like flavoprotein
MTPEQVALVQQTWTKVAPNAQVVADTFYNRLFELNPGYRNLFLGDAKLQGKKLTNMLNTVVANLERIEEIIPVVESLGRRHVSYGVTEGDYAVVGEALLSTLEQGLGEDFTDDARDAWTSAYSTLASVMIGAARRGESMSQATV